jgi:hypothetical protein
MNSTDHVTRNAEPQYNQNVGANPPAAAEAKPIPIDGFKQIVDMLRVADPAFRESLLKRLAQRDPALALSLRREV